ncbi:MAG: AIR synthase-related protein, partial [Methanoregulaceae archaeon]|nr:AIR synthase-related protein [Methanoregulaceae archaeon]
CYDVATAFGTPFISGKDSMYNDFSGFDAENNPVKVSVPPTLLISSIGVHEDVVQSVSMDAKIEGDLVYVIGETSEELGGSEYFAYLGSAGNVVPALDPVLVKARYERLTGAIRHDLVASACPVTSGGLGITLARVAIAGRLGMDLSIPPVMRPDYFLFSESLGRFVVTISPGNRDMFEKIVGDDAIMLGKVTGSNLRINGSGLLLEIPVAELENAYKAPFKEY